MRFLICLTILIASVAAAYADKSSGVSLSRQVQPIFDDNCVACHQDGAAQEGLSLEQGKAWAELVRKPSRQQKNVALVSPGSPTNSYLARKLRPTGPKNARQGQLMPIGGKLGQAQVGLIERWIAEGARNN